MIARILIGLLISTVSFLLAWKTQWFMQFTGYNSWAEQNMGPGGTRLMYKLLGIAGLLLGFMVITDLFDSFATSLLGNLFG